MWDPSLEMSNKSRSVEERKSTNGLGAFDRLKFASGGFSFTFG